jgi:Na+-transporting methylmalonyl-CoA/oxaloacetate decarboxylase gamma subunit
MNLGILNTVIAMVIVFLVLSLLVQSVQMFVKKILKLKSRQIVGSLEDLYEQAIETTAVAPATTATTGQKSSAKQFTDKVVGEFTKIGRVSYFGNPVLDSLSKEDLFKIMAKLESENFVPDYVKRFQDLCNELNTLRTAIETLAAHEVVKGAASAKLAEVRGVLAPVFNDVQSIVDASNTVRPRVLFGDLLRLGKLNPLGVLKLLNEAQNAITSEIEVASKTGPGSVTALQTLSNELSKIARLIGDLTQKFDDAFAPLRGKLEQVETWYDTVMQSFEERYTRNMKTVALCISIVVVIVLNANFFKVYSSLSTNDVRRNLVLESGERVLEAAKTANSSLTPTPMPSPSPQATATELAVTAAASPGGQTPTPSPTPTPAPSPTPDIKTLVEETQQDIDVYLSTYQEFGFAPLTMDDVRSWFMSIVGRTLLRNEKGVPLCEERDQEHKAIDIRVKPNCTLAWRDQSSTEWWASRRHDVFVLFGWAIMVLLLSVGAPFWQDALESLFGIKNLLRQKSGTENIETRSGAGQPKD